MEQTKKCTRCGAEKPFSAFSKDKNASDGIRGRCKPCRVEQQNEYQRRNIESIKLKRAEYYAANKIRIAERRVEYHKGYYTKNKDKLKAYAIENADKIAARVVNYRRDNRIKIAEKIALYSRSPAGKAHSARNRVERTFLKNACRLAETHAEAIKEIYRLANDVAELSGHEVHVDHICPLKAKVFDPDFGVSLPASGLHVPWNLDPIPAAVNRRKHNRTTLAEILA